MAEFNVRYTPANGSSSVRKFDGDDVHAAIAWGETLGKVTEVSMVVAKTVSTLEIIG